MNINTSNELTIAGRKIGYRHAPLVIAEIGINHGGSFDIARKMVDAAVSAGAEIIKHQTHVLEDELSAEAKNIIPGNADESIYEIMARCAMSEKQEVKLKEYIESKGVIFISTPFSRKAADRLQKMSVKAYKIGSGECNNYPFVEYIAKFGKPVILSTGMNDIKTIRPSVDILRRYNVPFVLLHCTNVYPTPDRLVRLGGMNELQAAFPDATIGLSDHTVDNLACLGAIACGASVLERHFTDSASRSGPDINCSMDTESMRDLINDAKRLASMRGGHKGAVDEEKATINFAYASVVADEKIKKGEALTEENIWVRRPGTGDFLAFEYASLIGRYAANDISEGAQIKRTDVVDMDVPE